MARESFERELQRMRDRILAMGSEVEHNIIEAIDVLRRRDAIGAQRVISGDLDINRRHVELLTDAMVLIATQQPMARDMRLIASSIEISGELERINDYVKGIARISLKIGPDPIPSSMDGLPLMAEKTRYMLHRALDAAAQRDAALAKQVPAGDTEVDDLFNIIYRNLVGFAAENPEKIELANHLEWVAHNLERAADRVTNICEWVVYNATGEYVEMDSELEAPPPQV
jgi:phosphate transport system protein